MQGWLTTYIGEKIMDNLRMRLVIKWKRSKDITDNLPWWMEVEAKAWYLWWDGRYISCAPILQFKINIRNVNIVPLINEILLQSLEGTCFNFWRRIGADPAWGWGWGGGRGWSRPLSHGASQSPITFFSHGWGGGERRKKWEEGGRIRETNTPQS